MSILIVKTIAALMPIQRLAQRFIQSYDQYRSLTRLLETSENARETWSGHATPRTERDITFDQVTVRLSRSAGAERTRSADSDRCHHRAHRAVRRRQVDHRRSAGRPLPAR